MLLTESQVQFAMKLIPLDIRHAAKRSGYGTESIYAARFQGMTPAGVFIYEIDYEDSVSGDGTCRVYLKYERLPMSKEYQLTMEF